MTPKEKAKELVDKFEYSFAGIISNEEDWETLAKQCALIAVDLRFQIEYGRICYWNEVKQQIEKL